MIDLPGYRVRGILYESAAHVLYYAETENTGEDVILKTMHAGSATPHRCSRLRLEYLLTSRVAPTSVIGARALVEHRNIPVFVKTDVHGVPLDQLIRAGGMDISDVLSIGVQLANALDAVHSAGIMHKDVKPENVIVVPETLQTFLTDLDIASELKQEHAEAAEVGELSGSLPYIAPEQTGRMNRAVDYRADFYSLGALLYEITTGRRPFHANDAMEMIHCHIARQPEPISVLRPDAPEALRSIIHRLMAKTAEDRYQSAFGLAEDLRRCQQEWSASGTIQPFLLATHDASDRLLIPQTLYGREADIQAIVDTFERSANGTTQFMTVCGYSGIGKTSLINEVQRSIAVRRGHFVSGKHDQYQRNLPYSALVQALERLIRQILSEPDAMLEEIRASIIDALRDQGSVITEVLPVLSILIGPQPDIVETGGLDAQRRFNETLTAFLGAVASPKHPLVLFLDDMQWADSATLSFIEHLTTSTELSLMFVLSYRDNEVPPTHPLMGCISVLERGPSAYRQLRLHPLTVEHVCELLHDALARSHDDVRPLAEILCRKTDGNPFFVNQFLKTLCERSSLYYSKSEKQWQWDLDDIIQGGMTDNVVELMTQKLRSFSPSVQHTLNIAAAIGGEFDLSLIATVNNDLRGTAEQLWEPLREGLVYIDGAVSLADVIQSIDDDLSLANSIRVRFQHDRIQQAAYALVSEDERALVHHRIGRAMFERSRTTDRDSIFEIAAQWNAGRRYCVLEEDILVLLQLDLKAALHALASAAFASARVYALTALENIPPNGWERHTELTRTIHETLAECDVLCAEFEHLDTICTTLTKHATMPAHSVLVYDVLRRSYIAQMRFPDAIDAALKAVALLGVKFPAKPTTAHAAAKLIQLKMMVGRKTPEDLRALPDLHDDRVYQIVRITAEIASAVYMTWPELFPLLLLKQMELTLRYGNHRYSASVFIGYAIIQAVALGEVRRAYALATAALSLPDRYNAKELASKNLSAYSFLIQHRVEPLDATYANYTQAYAVAIETGTFEDACLSYECRAFHESFQGKNLQGLLEAARHNHDTVVEWKQDRYTLTTEIYLQTFQLLLDPTAPTRFHGSWGREEEVFERAERTNDKSMLCSLHLHVAFVSYLHEDFGHALSHLSHGFRDIESMQGSIAEPIFAQYKALLALREAHGARPRARRSALRTARAALRLLRKWALDGPACTQHRVDLVMAEIHRVNGRYLDAFAAYDRSIAQASRFQFLADEGIANELAARMAETIGQSNAAREYARHALDCFRRWGAQGKVALLEQRYPEFVPRYAGSSSLDTTTTSTTSSHDRGTSLDLTSVVKASHVLAGEIDIDALLPKLMTIVMENAGAERGMLLLERQGQWLVEAESDLNHGHTRLMHSARPDGHLPLSLLSYVVRTHESVVLADAATSRQFMSDDYVVRQQPRSVLCIPITRQHTIIGVIYLENNLVTGAFTDERLEVLNLLSVQMGISIENAMLYESLERKVQERTAALEEEQRKSERLLLNVLPAGIVQRLKQGETTIADRSSNVTVLFADIVDFTHLSASIEPEQVVDILNTVFNHFDDLVERYGVEKIKTIGDAYMAVGGIPEPRADHADVMVRLALDMQASVPLVARAVGLDSIKIRVGIHTGSVIAGVIGRSKFSYDLWGDTVNTAARMESHGMPGRVHVSEDVIRHLNGRTTAYTIEQRDQIEIKGKGLMTTYFVS
ncbi:MAG: AAA family ATPase [Bacteroidetes bacterium]|nr:AAA family ATPase [Bacteroidota bacterium]